MLAWKECGARRMLTEGGRHLATAGADVEHQCTSGACVQPAGGAQCSVQGCQAETRGQICPPGGQLGVLKEGRIAPGCRHPAAAFLHRVLPSIAPDSHKFVKTW